MEFGFRRWEDGKTCERCAAEIHSGWIVDGKTYGPTCGIVILREAGIKFPDKFGPLAFDPEAMSEAVRLNEWKNGRWVHSYEARDAHRKIVGSVPWKIAQAIAAGKTVRLSGESIRSYEAVVKGLKS